MAPKHSDKLPVPSSSDEEEDTTSEAEEEEDEETSDEEEDQSQISLTQKISQIKKPEISCPLTAATDANESSESDGSESETDSDSAPVIKPLATKPMVDDAKKQQSAAKPSASGAKSKAKRPVESNSKPDQKESKRAKKEPGNGRAKNDSEDGEEKGKKIGDDAKKQLFQRIWSEEDEIALLKGMIEFKTQRGTDPAADVNAFYEFVKRSLHMDFGTVRLKDKMWRLKKKYKNNVKRGKGDAFGKEHDQEAYNLSKKIWLDDGEILKAESPAQSNGKSKKIQHVATPVKATPEASNKEIQWQIKKHDVPLDKKIGVGSIEEDVLSGINLIPSEKKAALEKRWKKLRIAEMELFLQRNELVSEQAKLMLDFYKSGKN